MFSHACQNNLVLINHTFFNFQARASLAAVAAAAAAAAAAVVESVQFVLLPPPASSLLFSGFETMLSPV